MLTIADVLSADEVARVRALIDGGAWIDGNATSGHQSVLAKRNRQLPEGAAEAREAGNLILDALGRAPEFVAAALPLKVYPPLFSRYEGDEGFGNHVDSAVRIRPGGDFRVRTDLAATLFLSDDYHGGELIAGDRTGVKLPAGHLLLYPASTVHRVEPVTRGVRVAAFFWVQSMVRGDAERAMLFDLDRTVQALAAKLGGADANVIELTGLYHNMLRRWAEV